MNYFKGRSGLSEAHRTADIPDFSPSRSMHPQGDIVERESPINADPGFEIRIQTPLDIQPIFKRQVFTVIDVHGDGVLLNAQVLDDVEALDVMLANTVRKALDPLLRCEELLITVPPDNERKKTIKDNLVVEFEKAHDGVRVNVSGKISYIMNGSLELEPLQAFALLRQDISAYISHFLSEGLLAEAERLYFMTQMTPDSSLYEDFAAYLEGKLAPIANRLGRVFE